MTPMLYLAQRGTAFILALAVAVHLATIIYAVQGGLSASEMLARTRGNLPFFLFYAIFALAAAIHAPIGLRSVLREWTGWRGASLDRAAAALALLLLVLGLRAAFAMYAS